MDKDKNDILFTGSISKVYAEYLVPLLFEPYATDLVKRLSPLPLSNVLEIAAGTGAVTRQLAAMMPDGVSIVATDLNEAMIEQARSIESQRAIKWCCADALSLPFRDNGFDAVVCQFGVMFFPDKVKAFSEVHRVLRPGGIFVFNVWDQIEENDFPHAVTEALAALFPTNPPCFLARVPHSYHSRGEIEQDLTAGGFSNAPHIEIVTKRSCAKAAQDVARAFCHGTPLRNEIEERGQLSDATVVATSAIAQKFGSDDITGKIQALVVSVRK